MCKKALKREQTEIYRKLLWALWIKVKHIIDFERRIFSEVFSEIELNLNKKNMFIW